MKKKKLIFEVGDVALIVTDDLFKIKKGTQVTIKDTDPWAEELPYYAVCPSGAEVWLRELDLGPLPKEPTKEQSSKTIGTISKKDIKNTIYMAMEMSNRVGDNLSKEQLKQFTTHYYDKYIAKVTQ